MKRTLRRILSFSSNQIRRTYSVKYFPSDALPSQYKPLESLCVPEYDPVLQADEIFLKEKLLEHPLSSSTKFDTIIPRILFDTRMIQFILSNMSHNYDTWVEFYHCWLQNMEWIAINYFDQDATNFTKLLEYVETVELKNGIQSQLLQFFWHIVYPVQVTNPEKMKLFFEQIQINYDYDKGEVPYEFASVLQDFNWLLRYMMVLFYAKQCHNNVLNRQIVLKESASLIKEVKESNMSSLGEHHNLQIARLAETVALFHNKFDHSAEEWNHYFTTTAEYLNILPIDKYGLYFLRKLIETSKQQMKNEEWKWQNYETMLQHSLDRYQECSSSK